MSLKRIAIKRRLLEGIAPEHVAEELKVSVETVMSVERLLRADPAAAHALNARPTPAPSASIDEAVGRAADEVVARASVDELPRCASRCGSWRSSTTRCGPLMRSASQASRRRSPGWRTSSPRSRTGRGQTNLVTVNLRTMRARATRRPATRLMGSLAQRPGRAAWRSRGSRRRVCRSGGLVYPERLPQLPATRADCRGLQRPCPHVRCKWHLFLDVNQRSGSIKFNFPGREVWELTSSCALDVAERGGETLEEVAERLNITRERVRQIEVNTASRLRDDYDLEDFDELSACWGGRAMNQHHCPVCLSTAFLAAELRRPASLCSNCGREATQSGPCRSCSGELFDDGAVHVMRCARCNVRPELPVSLATHGPFVGLWRTKLEGPSPAFRQRRQRALRCMDADAGRACAGSRRARLQGPRRRPERTPWPCLQLPSPQRPALAGTDPVRAPPRLRSPRRDEPRGGARPDGPPGQDGPGSPSPLATRSIPRRSTTRPTAFLTTVATATHGQVNGTRATSAASMSSASAASSGGAGAMNATPPGARPFVWPATHTTESSRPSSRATSSGRPQGLFRWRRWCESAARPPSRPRMSSPN
jgi:hypothetical protein